MLKIGSKGRPAIVRVQTMERYQEVAQIANKHGIHYIAGVEPHEQEDISDLMRAINPPQPVRALPKLGPNEPCSCGSGKKYKKCCIFVKTTAVVDPIRDALRPLHAEIVAAFIHGSVAEGRERSESDLDLIIVGDVAGPSLSKALRPLRARLGRDLNVTRYSADEFRAKRNAHDPFLEVVMAKPKLYVAGTDGDLARLET